MKEKSCHPSYFCIQYIEARSGKIAGKIQYQRGFNSTYLAVIYDRLTGSIKYMFEGNSLILVRLRLSIEMRRHNWEVEYLFDR